MPAPLRPSQCRPPGGPWIVSSGGNVFYRADGLPDPSPAPASLPTPLIGPRRARPHAIHIITYPPGYVPRELRPNKPRPRSRSRSRAQAAKSSRGAADRRSTSSRHHLQPQPQQHPHRPVLGKLRASFPALSLPSLAPSSSSSSSSPPVESRPSRASSLRSAAATTPSATPDPPAYDDVAPDPPNQSHVQSQGHSHRHSQGLSPSQQHPHRHGPCPSPVPADADAHSTTTMMMAASRTAYHLGAGSSGNRNSIMSVRSAKSAVSALVTEVPKPVATGSGVACSIILAEPNVFLSGFDHDDHVQRGGHPGTSLLRGKLHLTVSKNVKIKAIQLKLLGRARTEWPEGIPPLRQDVVEEESLRTQVLTFFNAMNHGWETEYGNQCVYRLNCAASPSHSAGTATAATSSSRPPSLSSRARGTGNVAPSSASHRSAPTSRELKRLSLQSVQSRSFGKADNSGVASATQAKGFKVFYPGTYDYSFELPIDHHQLETTKLQYGSVRWELHATVDRAGAFKPNLHGMKEVSVVRLPDQLSLETTEPISISRQWEDQLHYDIVISGKSFPISSRIPIAFKLTPLAKVQVHKLKVYVTESIEYWTNDRRVTRKDPGRKILLLEKSAGKPLDSAWASSDLTTVRGGEPSVGERRRAREIAQRRRAVEAARSHRSPEPLPEPTANLLGDLDLGLETIWGSTEIEANVQIPTCEMMAKNKDMRLHPDCSWKNVNVYHWIKIVMRISRPDPEDPTGTKRRHFEISIDSPFTVLNCRATQANTNLPAYAGPISQPSPYQSACGCPDAAPVAAPVSPNSSTGTLLGADMSSDVLPAPPQAAHLFGEPQSPARAAVEASGVYEDPRPIHLLRVPSFNPPAFDEDVAPPPAIVVEDPDAAMAPVMTPPPQYDAVVGTPSVDGLADYFARLADYGYHDEEDSASDSDELPPRILDRTGRVNVSHPRTPGRRMPSRSMEISRPPLSLSMDSLQNRSNRASMASDAAT